MPTVSPDPPTAIWSSSGLSTCTPLLPPDKVRKGRLASGASAPLTSKEDPVGAALNRQHRGRRIAAHQRRFQAEVARDLQIGGDAAARVEGAAGGRAADQELGEIRRRRIEGAGRGHRDVPVQADAPFSEAGQQGPVLPANGHQGVLDLQVARRALQLRRLHEAVRLLTVRSAGLFSRSVTRWPRELKLAMRG